MSTNIFQPFPTSGAVWDQYQGAVKQDMPNPPGITGETGIDEVGSEGTLSDVPLPPPRPIGIGGKISGGTILTNDFANDKHARAGVPTTPRTVSKHVMKSNFTPPTEGFLSIQLARLRELGTHLVTLGVDLQHSFTSLNIESRYARLNKSKNGTYIGPFQYGHVAMKAAMKTLKPPRHKFNRWSMKDQAIAFDADCKRFTQILKRRFGNNFVVKGWHLYLLHQQGPGGGPALLGANQSMNVVAFVRTVRGMSVAAVTGQAKEILQGQSAYTMTVGQWLAKFEAFYNKCRDGGGGRQATTDYIQANNVRVATGPNEFRTAAQVITTGAELIVSGIGIDLTVEPDGPLPQVVYQSDLRFVASQPPCIIVIDFYWEADLRSPYPENPNIHQILRFRRVDPTTGSFTALAIEGSIVIEEEPTVDVPHYSTVDFDEFSEAYTLKVVSCAGPHDYVRGAVCYAFAGGEEVTHRVWVRNLQYAGGGWPTGTHPNVTEYIASSGGIEYILPIGDPKPPSFELGPTFYVLTEGGEITRTQVAKLGIYQYDDQGRPRGAFGNYNPDDNTGGIVAPFGQSHRLAIRNGADALRVCLNRGTILEDTRPFAIADTGAAANTITATSRGMLKIERILVFPDDPEPQVLLALSDPMGRLPIGTEPGQI